MKTSHSISDQMRSKVLIAMVLLLCLCTDSDKEIPFSSYPDSHATSRDWVAFLDEHFRGAGIIVQRETSIQDAVNAASAGEAIYLEPGLYEEQLTIDKPGLKLIGVPGTGNESVIIGDAQQGISMTTAGRGAQLINIQHKGNNAAEPPERKATRKLSGSLEVTRHDLGNNVAHYEFEVQVGSGPFDIVRIHRVVHEHKPYIPVRTRGAVFMLHGASLSFEAIFLSAGSTDFSSQTSVAYYLASNDIDVWGMDFAWTLVPPGTTDFSFMEDWGVERDVAHTLSAMSFARLVRGLTGQGFGRLNLLGYSYGAGVAYAAAGRETQQHRMLRHIKGLIAVDQVLKYAPDQESNRQLICNAAAAILGQIDMGVYHSNGGQVFAAFSGLASAAPDDPSPFIPGLTNFQATLFVGTSTFMLPGPATPYWHFVGGSFDANNLPAGLLYSEPGRWIGLLGALPPFQPQKTTYEMRACVCNEVDVSMDDHFGDISVPILYLGAGGAFGELGYFTSSLTDSHDITNHNISLQSDPRLDFGHADLFLGNDARHLAWQVLYDWLVSHNASSHP